MCFLSCSSLPSLCRCETAMEDLKITPSCLFGGSTGDDEVWVHPLQLCVHSHSHSSHFLSTLNPSTPVLPAVHLSSQTAPSDDSPRSVPPLLSRRNVIFHLCWVCMVLRALGHFFFPSLSSLTPCLFFHLRLFISSHSSPPPLYLSRRGFHKVADVKSKRKQNGAER